MPMSMSSTTLTKWKMNAPSGLRITIVRVAGDVLFHLLVPAGRPLLGEVDGLAAADHVLERDVPIRDAEADRALVLVGEVGVDQFLQVAFVDLGALGLEIRPVVAAGLGALVPVDARASAGRR